MFYLVHEYSVSSLASCFLNTFMLFITLSPLSNLPRFTNAVFRVDRQGIGFISTSINSFYLACAAPAVLFFLS
ncbi:hypothetical protein F4810DRAFT_672709 [Camillea tinctor]|nr:hypothetical protein F4810DRAFT_672709 [Camillea tinctor]